MSVLLLLVFWVFAVWGLVTPRPVLVYLFFVTLPLGSFAIVPTGLTGGLTLLGAPMAVLLLSLKEFLLKPGGSRSFAQVVHGSKAGRLLLVYWAVSVVVTLFAPRIFQGQIDVIPMSSARLVATPLAPTQQNFSQLAYLTVSVLGVYAFANIFRPPYMTRVFCRGVVLASGVTVLSGLADFLSSYVPIAPTLRVFRTAQYSIVDDVSLADGTKRVVGLMPEASSFGALSMGLFALVYFTRPAIEEPQLRRQANYVLKGLGLMIVLSTSSASYVAIAVMLFLMMLDWFSRTMGTTRSALARNGMRRELSFTLISFGAIVVALMFIPSVFDPVVERVNDRVLAKTESSSFVERNMWSEVSFDAVRSSNFVGVGLGSTRTSNHAVAVLASTGLLGFLLYAGFVTRLLFAPVRFVEPHLLVIARACRWSFLPVLSVDILVGTTADFGALNAMRWGLLVLIANPLSVGRATQSIDLTTSKVSP